MTTMVMKNLKIKLMSIGITVIALLGFSSVYGLSGIVPQPVSQIQGKGTFSLTKETKFLFSFSGEHRDNIYNVIASHFMRFYGIEAPSPAFSEKFVKGAVCFILDEKSGVAPEGYRLDVDKSGIKAVASTYSGLFYAAQSLVQLMPSEERTMERVTVDAVKIQDAPRFPWRGLHLDVCRHFMPKQFV
ncbi:MAG: hypothetical protein EOM36_04390, partial [Bacteroidia bacterium]|nr:hypothetical protein [Bacteroidia bacterium]